MIFRFSQSKYRFQLYDNIDKLTWRQIQQKTGCCALCNLWYFDMRTYQHDVGVMLEGQWVRPAAYDWPGICIDKNGHVTTGGTADAVWDYAASVQADYTNGTRTNTTYWEADGVTYTGLTAHGDVVILLCSEDTPMDSEEAVQAMLDAGCVDILRWDGSWSSQGSLGPGLEVQPSQQRICRGWLLVFEREAEKEDKPVDKSYYTVTPSVGVNIRSGPGTGCGKVGAYAQGAVVAVLEERDGWGRTDMGWVSLAYLEPVEEAQRVTDNGITIQRDIIPAGRRNRPGGRNPDAYITIHETGNTDAGADAEAHGKYLAGSAGEASLTSWHYTVDDHAIVQHLPDNETAYHAGDGATGPGNTTSIGIEICVNSDGDFEKAKANAAALVRLLMAEHGIPLANVVQHNHWNGKNCPATIRATPGAWEAFLTLCSGESEEPQEPDEPQQPATDKPADWAARSWEKAVKKIGTDGKPILDGTRPADSISRQELAVVLDRLGLLD